MLHHNSVQLRPFDFSVMSLRYEIQLGAQIRRLRTVPRPSIISQELRFSVILNYDFI